MSRREDLVSIPVHCRCLDAANRVLAMVLRYSYLMRGSWPRILELVYWPSMQIIMWGFISEFLRQQHASLAGVSIAFLAAVLLWDVMFRGQLGVSVVFFEELYSRNLGHLFASPLRPYELVSALLIISFLRTLIGVGCAALLALWFYHYSIFRMGLPLVAFFSNLLIMGWSMGLLVSGLVLRYGLGAESLAWAGSFAIAPISGIYYPISVLPFWLRPVAKAIPASYVFHGMRMLLFHHVFDWHAFWISSALNGLYLLIGAASFFAIFRVARVRGLFLTLGE
ncbi:MAG: ABC transporter permease [Acidiferrobacteraceae bacterium]